MHPIIAETLKKERKQKQKEEERKAEKKRLKEQAKKDAIKAEKDAIEAAKQEKILSVHPLLRSHVEQEIKELEQEALEKAKQGEPFKLKDRRKEKKKNFKPDPKPIEVIPEEPEEPHLCQSCIAKNEHIIRSFKIRSCTHGLPGGEPEEKEEEVPDNIFSEREPPQEILPVEREGIDVAESSSSGDEEMRAKLTSKMSRIKKNRDKPWKQI